MIAYCSWDIVTHLPSNFKHSTVFSAKSCPIFLRATAKFVKVRRLIGLFVFSPFLSCPVLAESKAKAPAITGAFLLGIYNLLVVLTTVLTAAIVTAVTLEIEF